MKQRWCPDLGQHIGPHEWIDGALRSECPGRAAPGVGVCECGETPPAPPPGPQVTQVDWLYAYDYYDGPISGRVNVPMLGDGLWADMDYECYAGGGFGHSTCGFYRRYRLIRLSPQADAEQARRHALFREHVGIHWDFGENRDYLDKVRPAREWAKYFDQAKQWPQWTPEGETVGWFQQ